MKLSGRLQVMACVAVMGALAGCTSAPTDDGVPGGPDESGATSAAAAEPTGEATAPPAPTCREPGAAIVERAKVAIAPHPGPVEAATLVRAATTQTGTWFVIGIDRAYAADDGTLSGGASRSLALTNAPSGVNFIPVAFGETDKPLATLWDQVSWTGSRLAAGERALRAAIDCLDAASEPE